MALRRPSDRETRLAIKGQLDGLAVLAGKEPTPYLSHIPKQRRGRPPRALSGERLEKHVLNDLREWAHGREDMVLWRNASGQIALDNGQRIRYGLGPQGASDLIGYQIMRITQADVGKIFARFIAIEAKAPKGEPTYDQLKFIDRIIAAGGRAGIARSAEEAEEIVNG